LSSKVSRLKVNLIVRSYIHRYHLYFVSVGIHHRSEPSSNTNPPLPWAII